MYRLYTRPGSGGFVVEAAFELAGVPFERVNVAKTEPLPDDFLAISPVRQVPALVLPEGGSMTESAAMCMLIAERYPQARLAPPAGAPARADFLRWMVFMSSALYPALLRFFYAPRYTTDADGTDAVKQAATAESDRYFAIIDEALGGRTWLVGQEFSIADVYLLMLAHWHPVADRPRDEWKNIVRHAASLKQHPVLSALNEGHRIW